MTAAAGQGRPATPAGAGCAADAPRAGQPARDRFPARPGHGLAGDRAAARRGAAAAGPGAARGRPRPALHRAPGPAAAGLAGGPARRDLAGTVAGQRRRPAGPAGVEIPPPWLRERGHARPTGLTALSVALRAAVGADIVRPSLHWLLGGGAASNHFARAWRRNAIRPGSPGCEGCGRRSRAPPAPPPHDPPAAVIVAAKGGTLAEITIGDLWSSAAEAQLSAAGPAGSAGALRGAAGHGRHRHRGPPPSASCAPPARAPPSELIDRYQPGLPAGPRPARGLPARTPAGPGLLHPRASAACSASCSGPTWSSTILASPACTCPTTSPAPGSSGSRSRDQHARRRQMLTASRRADQLPPVPAPSAPSTSTWPSGPRGPARWAQWAVPCPVRGTRSRSRKTTQHRKSRMDARTRERLPVLPVLVSAVDRAAARTPPPCSPRHARPSPAGFTAAGQTLVRPPRTARHRRKVWAHDPPPASARDLTGEEDYAFWAWAAIEVLRLTGIRIEELLELSHHSLIQYRLPAPASSSPSSRSPRPKPTPSGCC